MIAVGNIRAFGGHFPVINGRDTVIPKPGLKRCPVIIDKTDGVLPQHSSIGGPIRGIPGHVDNVRRPPGKGIVILCRRGFDRIVRLRDIGGLGAVGIFFCLFQNRAVFIHEGDLIKIFRLRIHRGINGISRHCHNLRIPARKVIAVGNIRGFGGDFSVINGHCAVIPEPGLQFRVVLIHEADRVLPQHSIIGRPIGNIPGHVSDCRGPPRKGIVILRRRGFDRIVRLRNIGGFRAVRILRGLFQDRAVFIHKGDRVKIVRLRIRRGIGGITR